LKFCCLLLQLGYHAGSMRNEPMHPPLTIPFAQQPLDWTYKGLPQALLGKSPREIAAEGLSLLDSGALFPLATLREDILRANSKWMMRFLALHGAALAPHGKTTMSPELMQMQLRDGAWALTAATAHHVRAYRHWGVRRIFMANQLIGDGEIQWIAAELARDPAFDFYCLVDSVESLQHLADRLAIAPPGRPVQVLVEVGTAGGRTGVRSLEQGLHVAVAAGRCPQVALCGVETFEGLFQADDPSEQRAREMLEMTTELARRCDREGYFKTDTVLLSGGGSGLFDLAAQLLAARDFSRATRIVIRSGCYLVHDDGMYRMLFERLQRRTNVAHEIEGGLEPALQVWARVQSKPEPGRMICALGKRDVGSDAGLPTLVAWIPRGSRSARPIETPCRVTGLNDQHAYIEGDAGPFKVGDLVAFGVSHPCTTFDKWRALLTVDEQLRITGLVRTFF
jgi:D-serine dehydratase